MPRTSTKTTNRRPRLPMGFKEHTSRTGSVSYEYRFTVDGQRYSTYGRTVKECQTKADDKRLELATGSERRANPTLDQFRETWTETRTGSTKESTLRTQYYQYVACADVVLRNGRRLGDMKLRDITTQDVRDVQRALSDPDRATFRAGLVDGKRRQAPRRPRTTNATNGAIAHLSHVFDAAMKEHYITENPCSNVKDLRRTEKPARETIHRALTEKEQAAFFEAAKDSYYYDVMRFMVATGCRIGEAGALIPGDIRNGKIYIERTIIRNEIGGYEIGTSTKTDHGRRVIDLNDTITEILAHQYQITAELTGQNVRGVMDFRAPATPAEYAARAIFKSPEQKILRNEAVDREIARICDRIGMERFTAHALRATFATRFLELNPDTPNMVRTLQDILGHSDYRMTMNLYSHSMEDTKRGAMENMNKMNIAI